MKKGVLLAGPENYFILNNGSVLKDIGELYLAIKKISPEVYSYHVTKHKNDFANWIEHVFHNKKLSKEISKTKSQKDAELILRRFVLETKKKSHENNLQKIKKAKKIFNEGVSKKNFLNKIKGVFSNV